MEPAANNEAPPAGRMVHVIRIFERCILVILMSLLMVIVFLTTLELTWLLIRDLKTTSPLLLDVEEMFELFGFFLLVLIGMELLSTMKAYITVGVVHVEVVLEVALVALAQKIIVLDTTRAGGLALLGLAALVLALAAAFWWVHAARRQNASPLIQRLPPTTPRAPH